jgi:uncharacterized protein with von Willebrand factor type A (vWA) domain
LKTALINESLKSGNSLALTILPSGFGDSKDNNEFIFVVDCSGSMSGGRIHRARECLQLFIRSLPAGSFFDIVRFGTKFDRLFTAPTSYEKSSVQSGMMLAANMQANLGGTDLLGPLTAVFEQPTVRFLC